jgi:transposase-like protein
MVSFSLTLYRKYGILSQQVWKKEKEPRAFRGAGSFSSQIIACESEYKTIIRDFSCICKSKIFELNQRIAFDDATAGFNHYKAKCPKCGAYCCLAKHAKYDRYLVSPDDDKKINVIRFMCESCGSTHALLPDVAIPHSSFSLLFVFMVLLAYYSKNETLVAIATRFSISVSTIYRWRDKLIEHMTIIQDAVTKKKAYASKFLEGLMESCSLSTTLESFFMRFGFSFMQCKQVTTTRSRPP